METGGLRNFGKTTLLSTISSKTYIHTKMHCDYGGFDTLNKTKYRNKIVFIEPKYIEI